MKSRREPKNHSEEISNYRSALKGAKTKLVKTHIPAAFTDLVVEGEGTPFTSAHAQLEGQRYLGPSDAARYFSDRTWGPSDSSWTAYDMLCLGGHPNAFYLLGQTGLHTADDVTGRRFIATAATVEQLLHTVLAPYVSALRLMWSWYGWNLSDIDALATYINGSIPETAPIGP